MTRPKWWLPTFVMLLIYLGRIAAGAQISAKDADLVRTLSSGTPEERIAAVEAIRAIPVNERVPEVISALTGELDRLKKELENRRLALLAGQPIEPWRNQGEYLFNLIDLVTQQKDPTILGALIPFIDTGTKVVNAIARFGELAAGDVVAVAGGSSGASNSQVSSALFTLRRMLSDPVDYPLSEPSKRLMVDVARQRLTGIQNPVVVTRAIELGAATRDPNLIERIRTLAGDAGVVQELGISDTSLIERVQQKAAAALASIVR